jgi:hypothetical protein
VKRELGLYRCPACADDPDLWLAWAASVGRRPWPDESPVGQWVETIRDTTVKCPCCRGVAELLEPLGVAPPTRH